MSQLKASHKIILLIPLYMVFMSFSRGFYAQPSFYILFITFCCFSLLYFLGTLRPVSILTSQLELGLLIISIFSIAISFYFVKGLYQPSGAILEFNNFALLLASILIFTFVLEKQPRLLEKYRFLTLILLSVVINSLVIIASPSPRIDVFDSLKKGGEALLEGQNPYDFHYSQIYKGIPAYTYFPYPPGSLPFLAAIVFIFKDPRALMIISQTLTAIILFLILKKKCKSRKVQEMIPIIYLYFPMTYFIIEQSWLDPFGAFLLSAFAFTNLNSRRTKPLSSAILGTLITVKQYYVVILLFLFKNAHKYAKIIFLSIVFALLLISIFYFRQPEKFNIYRADYNYRFDALTLVSFIKNELGITLAKPIIYLCWAGLALLTYKTKRNDDYFIYLSLSYWLLGFFFFNFVAFVNEYYLSFSALILSYTLSFENKQSTS